MDYKKLFSENKQTTVVSKYLKKTAIDTLGDGIESMAHLSASVVKRDTWTPNIDYASPKEFVKYGSAEKYYADTFDYITSEYPYDGSGLEKTEFFNDLNPLEKFIFEQKYPTSTGYVVIDPSNSTTSAGTNGYLSSSAEYIQIKGGPHSGSIYSTIRGRGNNLEFGGPSGSAVEFFLKKTAFGTGVPTPDREVILDVWNGLSTSSLSYGRFTVEIDKDTPDRFFLTCMSGTGGFNRTAVPTTGGLTLAGTDWKYYSFSIQSSSVGNLIDFYVDGVCFGPQILTGTAVNSVTGSLVGNIGGLRTAPSGSSYVSMVGSSEGWAKFSGSLDEFRFWNKSRTSEQIGRHWFSHVEGGTNKHLANVGLGVYYKFNAGITNDVTIDRNVLDYSGRLSNGFFRGYSSSNRNTGSAINDLNITSVTESADPIVRPSNPLLKSARSAAVLTGSNYDYTNNTNLINSMPNWILEEDTRNGGELRIFTQIMASYLDTLYGQISDIPTIHNKDYVSGSVTGSIHEFPYNDRLLDSLGLEAPEIFENASLMAQYLQRGEQIKFEQQLNVVKNSIYKNIYNNLQNIFKSKGTEKSIRDFIRCLGVGEEIIALNLYANNSDFTLKSNYLTTTSPKKYVDFTGITNIEDSTATVYQFYDSSNINSYGLISALSAGEQFAITAEAEFYFPNKQPAHEQGILLPALLTSSLYGFNVPLRTAFNSTDTAWQTAVNDHGLHVRAVRSPSPYAEIVSPLDRCKDVYFAVYDRAGTQLLKSDTYQNVYDNKKWNLAFSVRPNKYQFANGVAGANISSGYTLELCGVNVEGGEEKESFKVSTPYSSGANLLDAAKRFYMGSYRTNASGGLLIKSDIYATSLRVWSDYLPSGTIGLHAFETDTYGRVNPLKNTLEFQTTKPQVYIPNAQTLVLNWDYNTITGSDTGGKFIVPDFSSGSSDGKYPSEYQGIFSNWNLRQHTGQGDHFKASSTTVAQKKYSTTNLLQAPDYAASNEMIKVLNTDPEVFTSLSRPVQFLFAVEKSLYRSISNRMLQLFASIDEFNNLIGEPVNKYRSHYKKMEKMREIFFRNVSNTPDLEKYMTFYQWLDTAMNEMLVQLFPASAVFAPNVRTLVEDHVLQRSKVKYFDTGLRNISPRPLGVVKGSDGSVCRDNPGWRLNHHPISGKQSENCYWWKTKALSNNPAMGGAAYLSNAGILNTRNHVRQALNTKLSSSQVVCIGSDMKTPIIGGINQYLNKYRNATGVTLSEFVTGSADCSDIIDPNQKTKFIYKATKNGEFYKGQMLSPFTAVSSSAKSGIRGLLDAKGFTNIALNNLHEDSIEVFGHSIPLQGPFTKTHVGGLQSRHVAPFITDGSHRRERYIMELPASSTGIMTLKPNNTGSIPKGQYLRNYAAKSILNIANILTTTGSAISTSGMNILGNFQKNYEVVQTSNRADTNMDFVFNNSAYISGGMPCAFISTPAMRSLGLSGSAQYSSPRQRSGRRINQSIFVERFAAPGSKQDSKQQFRDVPSDQFSPNNALPFRNHYIRGTHAGFGKLLRTGSYWGGFFVDVKPYLESTALGKSDYLNNLNNGESPIYPFWAITKMNISGTGVAQVAHKNPLNTTHRIIFANNINQNLAAHPPYLESYYQTGSLIDNGYVTRPIPAADRTQWFMNIAAGGWAVVANESPGGSAGFGGISHTLQQYIFSGSLYPPNIISTTSSLPSSLVLGNSGFSGQNGKSRYMWAGEKCFVPWQQLRSGETHAGRYYNQNLIYEINPVGAPDLSVDAIEGTAQFPSNTLTRTVIDRGGNTITNRYTSRFKEPFITSRYKPIIHQIETRLGTPSKTTSNKKVVELKYSYGNELQGFANKTLNTTIGNKLKKYLRGEEKRPYEILRDNFNSDLPRSINGANLIKSMIYSEVVYPREVYTYLSETRSRLVFENTFWKDDKPVIANPAALVASFIDYDDLNIPANQNNANRQMPRISTPFVTSQGYTVQRSEQVSYDGSKAVPSGNGSGSLWPMDSYLFSDQYQSLAALGAGQPELFAEATALPSGELMMTWYGSVDDRTGGGSTALYSLNSNILACQYVYTVPNLTSSAGTSLAEGRSPGGGYTLPAWTAAIERKVVDGSNKNTPAGKRFPFYDTYDAYAADVRAKGQDHTLIPEYRISENIETYNNIGGILSLATGSISITGSSFTQNNSSQTGFFERFGSTDLLEYLNPFMEVGTIDIDFNKTPKHFQIKSDAILKLLPYDGFYPATRTLQLGEKFYGAYNSAAKFQSFGVSVSNDVYWRTLLRPFFAPGILYNSIKSGMAVDYPIRRAKRNIGQFTEVPLLKNPLSGCLGDAITVTTAGQIPGNRRKFNRNQPFDFSNSNVDKFMWADRLPFEAIFNPENYARYSVNEGAPGWIVGSDINTILRSKIANISGSISEEALEDNENNLEDYKLAVSNFMAAVPHFFLKEKTAADGTKSTMTKIVATMPGSPDTNNSILGVDPRTVQVEAGKAYMMEIGLMRTELFNMYNNPYAFGIPTATGSADWDTYSATNGQAARPTGLNWPRHRGEFAPFTPPYFYGPSIVRLTYVPSETEDVTLRQILSSENLYTEYLNENGSYYDFSSGSFKDLDGNAADTTGTPAYGWNRAWQNRMDLDASICDVNAVPTDAGVVTPLDPNKWVIMPKWECPILDFQKPVSPGSAESAKYNFSSSIDIGHYDSFTYGMWHQYGTMPNNNQGVYLYIRDVGQEDTEFRLVGNPGGTASTPATSSITAVDPVTSAYDPSPGLGTGKTFIITTTTVSSLTFRFDATKAITAPDKDPISGEYLVGCNSIGSAADAATGILNAITLARTNGDIDVSAAIDSSTPTVVDLTADVAGTGMNAKTITGTAVSDGNVTVAAFAGGADGTNTGTRQLIRKIPSWIPDSIIENGIGSLASLVGFSDNDIMKTAGGKTTFDVSKAKRLGELAEDGEKSISEAIIAIPFYVGTDKEGNEVVTAMTTTANPEHIGPKLKEFRRSFTKYSLPPALSEQLSNLIPQNYPTIETYINPFAPPDHPQADSYNRMLSLDADITAPVVYMLQHTVRLSRQDLADMWQGIKPDIGNRLETQMTSIGHYMPNKLYANNGQNFVFKELSIAQMEAGFNPTGEALGDILDVSLPDSLNGMQPTVKWLVFKVKERGPTDYHTYIGEQVNGYDWMSFDKVFGETSTQGWSVSERNALQERRDAWAKTMYDLKHQKSYNWPYDFCSLIELGKLTTTFGFRPEIEREILEWTSEVPSPNVGEGNLDPSVPTSGAPSIGSNITSLSPQFGRLTGGSMLGLMASQDQPLRPPAAPADAMGDTFVPYFPNQ